MTNFKTSLKFFSILFFSVLLTSCSKDDSTSNEENLLLKSGSTSGLWMASDYEYIGEEHNRILAVYFDAILATGNLTTDFAIDVISNEVSQYDTIEEDIDIANEKIELAFNTDFSEASSLYFFLTEDENEYFLSLNIKSYLDDLGEIMDSSSNLGEALDSILYLENRIENNNEISNEKRMILFSATNTAKSSLIYWSENALEWFNYFNEEPQPQPMGFWNTIRNIGKADVYGAIGGAMGAAAVNIVPAWGQVAYGSAIIGTATATSTIAALSSLP